MFNRLLACAFWLLAAFFQPAAASDCHLTTPEFLSNWILSAMRRDLELSHDILSYLPKPALTLVCQETLSKKWRELASIEPLYRQVQRRFEEDPNNLVQRNEDFNAMMVALDRWIRKFISGTDELSASMLEVGLAVKAAMANRVCTLNSVSGLRLDGCRAFLTYFNTFYVPNFSV